MSTKVVEFKNNNKKHLKTTILMAGTVKKSLVWDQGRIKKLCLNINSINHPQYTTEESINKWKNRLKVAIESM